MDNPIKNNNIILIGPMGAGKSSIGKILAKKTGRHFFDSDHTIETRAGASISWIFEVEGEESFRLREEKIINELSSKENIVLSTGGGSITREATRERIKSRGLIVYLHVSFDIQLNRALRRTGHRPLLNVANPREALIRLNAEREPLYESIADIKINTDNQTPVRIANQILQAVKRMMLDDTESLEKKPAS